MAAQEETRGKRKGKRKEKRKEKKRGKQWRNSRSLSSISTGTKNPKSLFHFLFTSIGL
jgi:hypothetical protein